MTTGRIIRWPYRLSLTLHHLSALKSRCVSNVRERLCLRTCQNVKALHYIKAFISVVISRALCNSCAERSAYHAPCDVQKNIASVKIATLIVSVHLLHVARGFLQPSNRVACWDDWFGIRCGAGWKRHVVSKDQCTLAVTTMRPGHVGSKDRETRDQFPRTTRSSVVTSKQNQNPKSRRCITNDTMSVTQWHYVRDTMILCPWHNYESAPVAHASWCWEFSVYKIPVNEQNRF